MDTARDRTPSLTKRCPPFDETDSIYTSKIEYRPTQFRLHLPVLYNAQDANQRATRPAVIDPDDPNSVRAYFSQHLSVARLNIIHKHLWLAGLPRQVQPLHSHLLHGRRFVITERADHHLLWRDDVLLVMPLPLFLLDYSSWSEHLCTDQALFELANGMLLSYIWLIRSQSDLRIAHDSNLLPLELEWSAWTAFVRSTIKRLPIDGSENVNRRYAYGELRLGRINWIYRFCSRTRTFTTFIRGYSYAYTSYGSFFARNTAWIVSVIVYITIVLTAMQVGLATNELQNNLAFSRASYGLTILAIVGPMGALLLVALSLLVLVPFNLRYALRQRKNGARVDALTGQDDHR